jgi:hypothetical protein
MATVRQPVTTPGALDHGMRRDVGTLALLNLLTYASVGRFMSPHMAGGRHSGRSKIVGSR